MQQIKWVDRTFHFGYDKEYVPLFLERLAGTAPRLEELLLNRGDELNAVRLGQAWSAREHAGHLYDMESLHDGRVDDIISGLPVLRPADMTSKATYDALHNGKAVPELLALFRKTRTKFINRIAMLDERYFDLKSTHPRLQQMITITDSLFFIAEHDMHHLARIAQLLPVRK